MKHFINPTVDCVFKSLFGTEENKPLLIDFLNAILERSEHSLITDVTLMNPYNLQDHCRDKLTIIDVKARDASGALFQVEVQTSVFAQLPERMLYTWAHVYKDQLKEGQPYQQLCPAIAIWLLTDNLFPDESHPNEHHHFQVMDNQHHNLLSDHLHIHTVELRKWQNQHSGNSREKWLYFLREGKRIDADNPPSLLQQSPIMERAMAVLKQFSEKEQAYFRYQDEVDAERQQLSILYEKELQKKHLQEQLGQAKLEKQQALSEKKQAMLREKQAVSERQQAMSREKQAVSDKEKALSERQKFLALLKKHGIDPDADKSTH